MGDLTKNLSRKEFACECNCGFDTVDFELVNIIQKAVEDFESHFCKRIIVQITGPNRCEKRNEDIGGADNSQHICAKAADHKFWIITPDGGREQVDPDFVYDYYDRKYKNKYGVGKYDNRTHIDVRKKKARWG